MTQRRDGMLLQRSVKWVNNPTDRFKYGVDRRQSEITFTRWIEFREAGLTDEMAHHIRLAGDEGWWDYHDSEEIAYCPCINCGCPVRKNRLDLIYEHLLICKGVKHD